ncbi:MAG: hypothetical protein IKU55_02065 [Clostridia bacterium]|nr:hypothetical protein [Clostridia bacterium]
MNKSHLFSRTTAYFLMLAAFLGVFSACSEPPADPISVETPAQTTAVTLSPPPQAVNALFGVPFYDRGTPLNPLTETARINSDVCSLLFDTLFTLDENLQVHANLCSEVTATETGYLLTIRDGILFHDGTRLTANDVAYSLRLAMTEENSIYKSRFDGISSIGLDNTNHIVLILDEPRPSILAELDIPIIKQGTGYDRDAIGSGRYRMIETDDQRYLVPNTSHFSGQGIGAQMTHMQLTAVADADSLIYGVTSGNIDILRTTDAENAGIVLHANADRYSVETTELIYAAYGNHNAIFDHSNIRKTLGDAIAEAFADKVSAAPLLFSNRFGYFGEVSPAAAPQYSAAVRVATAFLQAGYRRDTDEQFVLSDGSYLTLRLLVNAADNTAADAVEQIAAMLADAGIASSIVAKTGDDYTTAIAKKQFDICFGAYDAGNDFDFTALLSNGAAAVFGIESSDLDLLLHSFLQIGTADGGLIARQIGERVAEQARLIAIGYRVETVLVNRKFSIYNVKMTADDIFYNIYDWAR